MDKLMNSYPVYAADQVLTNKSLNNSIGYLDQQNKFTRAGMIGNGVVCGLHYFVKGSKTIHIMAGYGSSIEGLLLQQYGVDGGQSTSFAYAKKYVLPPDVVSNENLRNPDATVISKTKREDSTGVNPFTEILKRSYELIPLADENNSVEKISVAELANQNLILFLYLEIVDIKSENCSPEDCDEKGKLRRLRVVPLLAEAQLFQQQNYTGNRIDILNLYRMMDFENQYSSNELYYEFAKINELNFTQIKFKLAEIKKIFENENHIVNDIENYLLENFESNIKKYVLEPNDGVQYAYDFLIDVGIALNEYAQHINCHPTTTCSFTSIRYDRTLVLGKILDINTYTDAYRYRFVEAPSVQEDNQYKAIAYKMYKRVWVLIQAYFGWQQSGRFANRGIIVSPSKSSPSLLGSRALPFYYNINGEERNPFSLDYLLEQWSAHTCSNRSMYDIYGYNMLQIDKPSGNYDYNKTVLGNGINEYNFFRIEGHMGLDVNEAEKKVNDLINQKNLPFRTFRLNIKRNNPDVENPTKGFTGKITEASAKLRKAAAVDIQAARVALPADQIPQITFENFNLYAQDFLGIGLNGATNLGGAITAGNYTIDMFRLNTKPVQTNPRIITIDYSAFTGTGRTVRLQVIGSNVGGQSNMVFAGETYSISIVLGIDYTYYTMAENTKVVATNPIITAATPTATGERVATDASGDTGVGEAAITTAAIVPRYNRPITVTVTAVDGDTVETIAASLVSELLRLSASLGQYNTVASATSNLDIITLTVRNASYASYAYSVTGNATAVASGLTNYLSIEYIGGGTLLSPVEISVCYKSPDKEINTSAKVRMLTGESLVSFPPTLRAFLQGPAEYYELCAVVPLVLDDDDDDPPFDTEYNVWPFDAKGNLLFNIFKGAEHLAGVYRGGTFIFLTETMQGREGTIEKVVGDIALPWDLEFIKLSRAVALKFNRKYWKWGNQWDVLPTLDIGIK
jgi:hypothetical protein